MRHDLNIISEFGSGGGERCENGDIAENIQIANKGYCGYLNKFVNL